jgi:hypothetical protein
MNVTLTTAGATTSVPTLWEASTVHVDPGFTSPGQILDLAAMLMSVPKTMEAALMFAKIILAVTNVTVRQV